MVRIVHAQRTFTRLGLRTFSACRLTTRRGISDGVLRILTDRNT